MRTLKKIINHLNKLKITYQPLLGIIQTTAQIGNLKASVVKCSLHSHHLMLLERTILKISILHQFCHGRIINLHLLQNTILFLHKLAKSQTMFILSTSQIPSLIQLDSMDFGAPNHSILFLNLRIILSDGTLITSSSIMPPSIDSTVLKLTLRCKSTIRIPWVILLLVQLQSRQLFLFSSIRMELSHQAHSLNNYSQLIKQNLVLPI